MRLRDVVTPHELKEANLLLMLEGARQVGGGPALRRRTRERSKLPSDALLQALLDEIPDVARDEARAAWSHWMALVTVRQPFFDANHRTALVAFNRATTSAWGFEYRLATSDLEQMMVGSRKLVKQAHKPGADAPRICKRGLPARPWASGQGVLHWLRPQTRRSDAVMDGCAAGSLPPPPHEFLPRTSVGALRVAALEPPAIGPCQGSVGSLFQKGRFRRPATRTRTSRPSPAPRRPRGGRRSAPRCSWR